MLWTPLSKYAPKELRLLTRHLQHVPISKLRACRCDSEVEVIFERPDGLRIAGSLYGGKGNAERPGILLLHGNTPLGRKLGFYEVLATLLSKRGAVVLSFDFTGFGESDDPFLGSAKGLWENGRDVEAAIDYLLRLQNIDPARISIIGHSRGAIFGFEVGIRRPEIKNLIAIGPPRRVTERMQDPSDRDYFWEREIQTRAQIYKKSFPPSFTKALWLEGFLDSDMEKHIAYFSQTHHKPLLLIDGERESAKDRAYLKNYYDKIEEPKSYLTIQNSDHYGNTWELGGFDLYDQGVMSDTADGILKWMNAMSEV